MKKSFVIFIVMIAISAGLMSGCEKADDDIKGSKKIEQNEKKEQDGENEEEKEYDAKEASSEQSVEMFDWGFISHVHDENLGELTADDNTYRIYRHITKDYFNNTEEESFYASVLVKDPDAILREVEYEGEIYPVVYLERVDPTIVKSIDVPDFIWMIGDFCFTVNRTQFDANTKEVNLNEGLGKISAHAFASSGITSIYIPNTVESIGVGAFQDCTALERVEFGDNINLTELQSTVFANCSRLKEINIPASVTDIGADLFPWCDSLEKVTFENPGTWHLHRKHNGVEEDYDIDVSDAVQNTQYLTDTYLDFAWKRN